MMSAVLGVTAVLAAVTPFPTTHTNLGRFQ